MQGNTRGTLLPSPTPPLSLCFLDPSPAPTMPRKKSVSIVPEPEDLYNLAHRTFELTSFDQLLKEASQSQTKKIVSINDVNQSAFQSTSFMKLWKTVRAPIQRLVNDHFSQRRWQKSSRLQKKPSRSQFRAKRKMKTMMKNHRRTMI